MKKLSIFLAIFFAYTLFGHLGLQFVTINAVTSPIWPASGIAVGMLMVFGRQYVLAILAASFAVNYSVTGLSLVTALMAFGNMAEAYVSVSILIWASRFFPKRIYSELIFIPLSAMAGATISATVGNLTLSYFMGLAPQDFTISWFTWWSGNTIGTIIIAPLFLEYQFYGKESFKKIKPLLGLVVGVFMTAVISSIFLADLNEAFAWAFGVLFIATGLIIGRPFSKIMLVISSTIVVTLTAYGYGPFELGNYNSNLIYIQMLLLSYALSVYFINPLTTNFKIHYRYFLGIAFGWLCIFFAVFIFSKSETQRAVSDFNKITDTAIQNLLQTALRYEALILSAESFYKIKPNMSAAEWRDFTLNQRIHEYYEAINGVVLTERVEKEKLQNFLKNHKIHLRSMDQRYAAQFNDHYIVRFIEPIEKNRNVIGLDVGSEKIRREGILKSFSINRPVATKTIYLVQDKERRKSFNLLKTISDSKGEILGSIHLPTIHDNFFKNVFQKFDHILNVRVRSEAEIVFDQISNGKNISKRKPFILKKNVFFFGDEFEFEFYPKSRFFLNYAGHASTIAFLLNFFLLLITAFLLEQLSHGFRVEAMVAERTHELEKSQIQLVQSSKMASLGEMAGSIAHEINNPLAIILGKLSKISSDLKDLKVENKPIQEEINKIKININRIDRIIIGLTNYSRSSSKDPFELTYLKDIIGETMDLCSETLKSKGIRVIIKDLPSVFLMCRQGQISQVLINLLNNSKDAISELTDKWIELSFEIKNTKSLNIIITDSGTGIPPEVLNNIMTPFYSTKMRTKGTGLGLSISKGIIEAHSGKIWVDRAHPHTRFIIEIPIATEEA